MHIDSLQWDSDFFNLQVGKLTFENTPILDTNFTNTEKYDLIYIFSKKKIKTILNFDISLVDEKIIYQKNINSKATVEKNPNVQFYNTQENSNDLYKLALQSGEFSRFKIDKKLPKNSFENLYKIWIEKSVSHEIADYIFVYKIKNKIVSMATIKIKDEIGIIGLVATDNEFRGKGYGSVILSTCETFLHSKGIKKLEVATQLQNKRACSYYEKNGFKRKSVTNIYHWWLKK